MDLATIVQEYESYYFLRFQKYPKICKKVINEDSKKTPPRKIISQESETTKSRQNDMQKENKVQVTKSIGKTANNNALKSPKHNVSLLDLDIVVLPLTPNGFLSGNGNQNSVQESTSDRLLKPLSGCSTYSAEWREFAEIISKVIC